MSEAWERLRSLQEQGLVERVDLEETNGDPEEIVKTVLARLRAGNDWFFEHPEHPSNLLPGETNPGGQPDYSCPVPKVP